MPDACFTQWQAVLQKSETSSSRSSSEPGGAIHSSIRPPSIHLSIRSLVSTSVIGPVLQTFEHTGRRRKTILKHSSPAQTPTPQPKKQALFGAFTERFFFFWEIFFFRNWHLGTWGCKIFHSSLVLVLGPRLIFPGYMADITPIIYWCYTRSHTRPVLLVEEGFGTDRLVSEPPTGMVFSTTRTVLSTIYPGLHPIYQYYTPLSL